MFSVPASTLRYYEDEGILTNVEKDASGQRIYKECHVRRLRTIFCFKHAGMTISQLKKFFEYEENESDHIDDILSLIREQEQQLSAQIAQLHKDHDHILRKLTFYSDVKDALDHGKARPEWKNYRDR